MCPPADPLDDPHPPAQPIPPYALTTDAELRLVPALIAAAGNAAGWRYVEFFPANIRNPNTRRRMVRKRALAAGIMAPIGNHSFRATAHESPRTTKLYDRTKERLTQDDDAWQKRLAARHGCILRPASCWQG